jgi:anthranilate synthase/aminodeoxychorismate synthase-like glutamine amidotransferase
MKARVLLVDNYDSFTYNLVQALEILGAEVLVHRNDQIALSAARELGPSHLVVSPGPGRPEKAGVSMQIISEMMTHIPVLGVCLGHQALAAVLGATITSAQRLMHGKSSAIHHDGQTLYEGLPNPFIAGRYHSLAVTEGTIPADLSISAHTSDGQIMGLRHRTLPAEGVQFHPESVLTPQGQRLLHNFLCLSAPG